MNPRGYVMPAEWAEHRATWIAWPHERRDWPGKLAAIRWVYAEIVRKLAPNERVCILVRHATEERQARRILERADAPLSAVRFYRVPTDRVWTRDSGPTFVKNRAALHAFLLGAGSPKAVVEFESNKRNPPRKPPSPSTTTGGGVDRYPPAAIFTATS